MYKYAILTNPGHNRVYFESSKKLAIQELSIMLSNLSHQLLRKSNLCDFVSHKDNSSNNSLHEDNLCECSSPYNNISDIKEESIGNIFYITFQSDNELNEIMISNISRLSFLYAFFQIKEMQDNLVLVPISKSDNQYLNENISSILKYTGKTNEIFTRMMINIALFTSKFIGEDINILDPIAGKGTTLYEGLVFGHHSYGIEISDKVSLESYHFIKKYLEIEKLKHSSKKETIGISGSKSTKYSIQINKNKEDSKENKNWAIVAGDSKNADKYYKKEFFHLIVGDLPYGVQHGNITKDKQSSITRNPKELVHSCIKSWHKVLKKEGVLVLAWNNFLLSRLEFTEILENSGFQVLSSDFYLHFEHRVDQAIRRDIIVAKKSLS